MLLMMRCECCNSRISPMENYHSFELPDKYLCKTCLAEFRPAITALRQFSYVKSPKKFRKCHQAFDEVLKTVPDNARVYKVLQTELQQRVFEFRKKYKYVTKTCECDFEKIYDAIAESGLHISEGSKGHLPDVLEFGDIKTSTFVFEKYFIRNSSYASIMVNLVYQQGIATITALASGSGDGLINFSWGADEDFEDSFWSRLQKSLPGLKLIERQLEL